MQRKNEALLSKGIITQTGEFCKSKVNLVVQNGENKKVTINDLVGTVPDGIKI